MRLGCAAVVGPLCLWQMCPGTKNTQVKHVNDSLWCRITSQNRPPFIRNYCNFRVGTPGNPLKMVSDRICVTNLLVFFTDVSCLHPCEWTCTQNIPIVEAGNSSSQPSCLGSILVFRGVFFHIFDVAIFISVLFMLISPSKASLFLIRCKSRWQLENILFTYLHVKWPHVLQVVILYDFVNSRLLEGSIP